MQRRAADEPPQHVAASFVRRRDPVGDEERRGARMLGDHAHRNVARGVVAVLRPGERLDLPHERLEQIGLERVRDALEDLRRPLETGPGVDVPLREGHERAVGLAVVGLEHEVPDLEVPAALLAGIALVRWHARLRAAIDEDLTARPAEAGRARRPEVRVVALREVAETEHLLWRKERQLLRPDVEGLVVVEVHRRDEGLRIDLELAGEELPPPGDRFLLPVIPDPEVPEHLEEGVVERVEPDDVEVRGAEALLHRDEPLRRRLLLPDEVRDDRLHPCAREQDARVVLQDERRAGQAVMPLLLEELDEALADRLAVYRRARPFI